MENECKVSVICAVYNHRDYLERLIKGFINQKTSFCFEVIIHDDCSTDGSQLIINRYSEQYPDIIHPIIQAENQYSKGINILKTYLLPKVKGKYIAICEGDDCWIDEEKLQKQFDYMEANSNCTFCFTNALIHNVRNGRSRPFVPYLKSDKELIRDDYDVIELSRLSFIPTCSFFFPTKNYSEFPDSFWERSFAEDRKLSLFSASLGYAHYISDTTCVYSYAVPGSSMTRKKTKLDIAKIELSFANIYRNLDASLKFKRHTDLNSTIISYLTKAYLYSGRTSLLSNTEFELVKSTISSKDKFKRSIINIVPNPLFNFIRYLKRVFFI